MVGMTFLALNGDAYLVASVARSFDLAPLSTSALSPNLMQSAAGDVLTVAELGLQIAMPIAATLFASDLLLGVVSRALPQLNVFVLSLPLNIILGLMAIIGSLAATVLFLGNQVSDMPSMLLALVRHV
jgi:flagellar biosynthetic protein FliR